MLAFALLAALESPKTPQPSPLRLVCPSVPAPLAGQPMPRTCPALEVSGQITAAGITIDPAFDVDVAPAEFTHADRGDAVLTGYGADGRAVFTQPFPAGGPFHLYVPLAPALARTVVRLHVSSGPVTADEVATAHAEPQAEILEIDATHVLVAWNALAFPGLRVTDNKNAPPALVAQGTVSFEQRTVETAARTLQVEFSDGVHSIARTYRVFGR